MEERWGGGERETVGVEGEERGGREGRGEGEERRWGRARKRERGTTLSL